MADTDGEQSTPQPECFLQISKIINMLAKKCSALQDNILNSSIQNPKCCLYNEFENKRKILEGVVHEF